MNQNWIQTESPSSKKLWSREVHLALQTAKGIYTPNTKVTLTGSLNDPLDYFSDKPDMYTNPKRGSSRLSPKGLQHLIYYLDHPDPQARTKAANRLKSHLDPAKGLPLLKKLKTLSYEWRPLSVLHSDYRVHKASRAKLWYKDRKMKQEAWAHYLSVYREALGNLTRKHQLIVRELFCLHHFARFAWYSGDPPEYEYFGCRLCGSTVNSIRVPHITAVIDHDMQEAVQWTDTSLRINLLHYDQLIDYDVLEIHTGSEDEIQHFCILIGNDADSHRNGIYEETDIIFGPQMVVTDNIRRDLGRFFPRLLEP